MWITSLVVLAVVWYDEYSYLKFNLLKDKTFIPAVTATNIKSVVGPNMNNEILQTNNFIVEAHSRPFISREEGGHIRIKVKDLDIVDRTMLAPSLAIELMRLTMVVGQALQIAMNKNGIPVIKVNYQDMGNWAFKEGKTPFLHVHVFGRAISAVKQPWPESMYLPDRKTGFYEGFEPLNESDISMIREEIEKIFKEEKYQDKNWHL